MHAPEMRGNMEPDRKKLGLSLPWREIRYRWGGNHRTFQQKPDSRANSRAPGLTTSMDSADIVLIDDSKLNKIRDTLITRMETVAVAESVTCGILQTAFASVP